MMHFTLHVQQGVNVKDWCYQLPLCVRSVQTEPTVDAFLSETCSWSPYRGSWNTTCSYKYVVTQTLVFLRSCGPVRPRFILYFVPPGAGQTHHWPQGQGEPSLSSGRHESKCVFTHACVYNIYLSACISCICLVFPGPGAVCERGETG